MDFSIPAKNMVYHPLSRLVPLFIQQRYDTNPAVRSTCSQKIYLLCLSGVEGLLSGAQKPLNDHVTNLQLKTGDPSGASPLRDRQACALGKTFAKWSFAEKAPLFRQGLCRTPQMQGTESEGEGSVLTHMTKPES